MDSQQSQYNVEILDRSRKDFLYSAFPLSRNVNPKHWDAKLSFWFSEIQKSANLLNDICVDICKLQKRFDIGSGAPLGLNVVISELIQDGTLVPIERYFTVFQDSWLQWASQLSVSSASWIWGKVTRQNNDYKEYILLQELKDKADKLLAEHNSRSKHGRMEVVPLPVIQRYKVDGLPFDEKTLTLVLGYLKQQGKVHVFVNEDGQKIVKFAEKGRAKAEKINDSDLQILKLKQTIARLQLKQKLHLEEAESLRRKAKNTASQNWEEAKRYLKESKRITKYVSKIEGHLSLLIDQLARIRDMDDQKMVVEALDTSSSLLKNLLKEGDLSVERVEEVVSETEDTLDSIKELDDVITEGLHQLSLDDKFDLEELEKELDNILLNAPDTPLEINPPNDAREENLPSVSLSEETDQGRTQKKKCMVALEG